MKVEEILKEINALKPRARKALIENVIHMMDQLESSVMLRGPYRLVLDSNIIMRIEDYRQGKVTEGFLSILLVFKVIEKLHYHIDLVIRPSVFYEYLRLKNVSSTREHWQKFKELKSLIEDELGSTLFFDGIETFSGAEYYCDLIQKDSSRIIKTLTSYDKMDWRFNFIQHPGCGFAGFPAKNGEFLLVPPLFAAEGLYTEIGLEYFNEQRVSRFFVEHIEKKISDCIDNDQGVIKHYSSNKEFLLAKVLKLSGKGNLEGLADLDIFSLCNVQAQFRDQSHGRYVPASIGLSIDRGLSNALRKFSSMTITSSNLQSGSEHADDNEAKMEAFIHDQVRVREGEERLIFVRKIGKDVLTNLSL